MAESTVPAILEAEFLAGRDLGCDLLDELDALDPDQCSIDRHESCDRRGITQCASVLLGYIGKLSGASNSFALGFAAVVGDRIAFEDTTPGAYYRSLTAEQMRLHESNDAADCTVRPAAPPRQQPALRLVGQ